MRLVMRGALARSGLFETGGGGLPSLLWGRLLAGAACLGGSRGMGSGVPSREAGLSRPMEGVAGRRGTLPLLLLLTLMPWGDGVSCKLAGPAGGASLLAPKGGSALVLACHHARAAQENTLSSSVLCTVMFVCQMRCKLDA